jgi:flavin-dependent dehydrogenase
MDDRHQTVMAAAAELDAFLARAAEEFGVSVHDRFERAETNRRINAWINQARALPKPR